MTADPSTVLQRAKLKRKILDAERAAKALVYDPEANR
jgi:hypothetical protein